MCKCKPFKFNLEILDPRVKSNFQIHIKNDGVLEKDFCPYKFKWLSIQTNYFTAFNSVVFQI